MFSDKNIKIVVKSYYKLNQDLPSNYLKGHAYKAEPYKNMPAGLSNKRALGQRGQTTYRSDHLWLNSSANITDRDYIDLSRLIRMANIKSLSG